MKRIKKEFENWEDYIKYVKEMIADGWQMVTSRPNQDYKIGERLTYIANFKKI